MPDKPSTIATYAAGAGLAAVALVYVFGPTFFLDDDAAQSTRSGRKKGVVGLYNPANDCFINSVLQTLAGLPQLRVYLIRELHRRNLDGKEIYAFVEQDDKDISANEGKDIVQTIEVKEPSWKVLGLQQGMVTAGLKQVLDALNERPIYKKTISASGFVHVLEQAFRTRVSRQQQDAQEFLQVVTERLSDEYYAGRKARTTAKSLRSLHSMSSLRNGTLGRASTAGSSQSYSPPTTPDAVEAINTSGIGSRGSSSGHNNIPGLQPEHEEDSGFPFEGQLSSHVECLTCHFKPAPSVSSFVTLTLSVPSQSSTSLNTCFDGLLKIEHIDDYNCDCCRLRHAVETKQAALARTSEEGEHMRLQRDIALLEHSIATNPEVPPAGVRLPDRSLAPKRRIAKHMFISKFPRVLAIHLSRSVWDPSASSSKNMAKVAFPETLPLGSIINQQSYHLLGVVTHKGGHNSGHYESFRRQFLPEPFATKNTMGTEGVYSARNSPMPSGVPSPMMKPHSGGSVSGSGSSAAFAATSAPDTPTAAAAAAAAAPSPSPLLHSSVSSASLSSSSASLSKKKDRKDKLKKKKKNITLAPADHQQAHQDAQAESDTDPRRPSMITRSMDVARTYNAQRRTRREHNRWWRISDDKIKESKTSDVLGMQREAYLLFYEIEAPGS